MAQVPRAPSYLVANYAAVLCGVAAAYLTCLVLFGPHSFIGNTVDAVLAAGVAFGSYRAIDMVAHRALRRLGVEAPPAPHTAPGKLGKAAGGGGGLPDLAGLLGGGGGMPDLAKLLADPNFAKFAADMEQNQRPRLA